MKMLDNSTRELSSLHKHLLYKMYIMPITLYDFQLWYFKRVLLFHPLKKLKKIQWRAAIWITNAFQMSPSWGVEAIASLILIYLYFDKISSRHHLRVTSLSKQHTINSFLDNQHSKKMKSHCLSMDNLTDKQCLKIKSSIVDTNNHSLIVFPFIQ